jgi:hypothetical protein
MASSLKRASPQTGPGTMAEKIDEDATITDTIDLMIQAIVDQMHLDGEDRLKLKIALCEAIAETYTEKAQLFRLLQTEPPAVARPPVLRGLKGPAGDRC